MILETARFVLRDLLESDRAAFVAYRTDRGQALFDLFVAWQRDVPRRNFQVGIFERDTARLLGCAGLRTAGREAGTAVLGIELTPDDWGRYRLAIDAASALIEHGFTDLGLRSIVGETAGDNKRVEKLARWFGANIVARREGPPMEIVWALSREDWRKRP